MSDQASVIARVCELLNSGNVVDAERLVNDEYEFTPEEPIVRRYSPAQIVAVFLRDGFIDRYSGHRLVFTPVLRLITEQLSAGVFPFHVNWKRSRTHPAYWDLAPTIDHVVPVTRSGSNDGVNLVTTSQTRNSLKGSARLDEIGWRLHEPGRLVDWDGLTGWYAGFLETHPERVDKYHRVWLAALRQASHIVTAHDGEDVHPVRSLRPEFIRDCP